MKTLLSYLMDRISVDTQTQCWNFTGPDSGQGYGSGCFQGKKEAAHRMAYRVFVGDIPKGRVVHHLCRNRRCCNPYHLKAISPSEHPLLDPTIVQANKNKTHCLRGHAFTPENTYAQPGGRGCKTCRRLLAAERYQRKHSGAGPRNADKTHCIHGHSFDEENTVHTLCRGKLIRQCRTCNRASVRRAYDKKHPDRKGRTGRPRGVNLKTHCLRGHEFTEDNTVWDRGFRKCRTCKNERQKRKYHTSLIQNYNKDFLIVEKGLKLS